MAETSPAAQLGVQRRQPARPLATGPRGPGGRAETIEPARARASPPGGPGSRARGGRRLAARPAPGDTGGNAATWWSALGPALAATAKCYAKERPKPPHKATSLGNNFAFLFSCGLAPLHERLGFLLFRILPDSGLKVNRRKFFVINLCAQAF